MNQAKTIPADKSVEELTESFMSRSGPLGSIDKAIIKELKPRGYCAGFGGTGMVAVRWVCKEGDFNALMQDLKCGCAA